MAKRTRSYADEAFKQISQQPDVTDIVVLNAAGNPVRTTMEEQKSLEHAGMWSQLMQKAKYVVQQTNPEDDVLFLRVRTKKHETLVTPDEKLTFVVIQKSTDKNKLRNSS